MCGIAGFWDATASTGAPELESALKNMCGAIRHRGPDDQGTWVDAASGVALGHRRLSIIDLSPLGHQPMFSASERYAVTFNGEIYNFNALREELRKKGRTFRGRSDTEVMLAAFEEWGVADAVKKFTGMFAFALWDRSEKVLHLVRDRIGKKPLYYGWQGKTLLFGSELKALRAHDAFAADINRDALALFLRHNYIPGPHSIYNGIFKLTPGTILTLRARDAGNSPAPSPYWSFAGAVESAKRNPFDGSEEEAIGELDALLRDATKIRMESDVPLGVFLSGGIDSSLVTALMQAQSAQPIRTFTIGFNEAGFNEAEFAKQIARHLGTDHTELYVTPKESLDVIPLLPALYDEPFSDSSQIPTYLVSKMARRHVTVCLAGDGGDETFHGYDRYWMVQNIWSKIGWMPRAARTVFAGGLRVIPPRGWEAAFGKLSALSPNIGKRNGVGDKIHKLAEILTVENSGKLYNEFISHWKDPEALVLGGREPLAAPANGNGRGLSLSEKMMYLDTLTYLPDDILVKVDRASMGVSLEVRAPLLDHRVVEFAWRLPMRMKTRNGKTKWILRKILDRYVPKELIERPKMGFGVPLEAWLRGELKEWASALLDESRLKREGFFNPGPIREKWEEHLSGKRNWHYYLWDILMFQAWLESQRAASVAAANA